METTVGQLNFFEWALNDDVLDYIDEHHSEIHTDMETRLNEAKGLVEPKKRHELSRSATNSLKRHDVKTTVRFD